VLRYQVDVRCSTLPTCAASTTRVIPEDPSSFDASGLPDTITFENKSLITWERSCCSLPCAETWGAARRGGDFHGSPDLPHARQLRTHAQRHLPPRTREGMLPAPPLWPRRCTINSWSTGAAELPGAGEPATGTSGHPEQLSTLIGRRPGWLSEAGRMRSPDLKYTTTEGPFGALKTFQLVCFGSGGQDLNACDLASSPTSYRAAPLPSNAEAHPIRPTAGRASPATLQLGVAGGGSGVGSRCRGRRLLPRRQEGDLAGLDQSPSPRARCARWPRGRSPGASLVLEGGQLRLAALDLLLQLLDLAVAAARGPGKPLSPNTAARLLPTNTMDRNRASAAEARGGGAAPLPGRAWGGRGGGRSAWRPRARSGRGARRCGGAPAKGT
jgi:hypothetical protein